MDIYNIVKRPLVTEKGTHQSQQSHEATRTKPARGGAYTFEVHPEASKAAIKQAVENIYKVKVLSVRTANRPMPPLPPSATTFMSAPPGRRARGLRSLREF